MPTKEDHLNQANRNQEFLQSIKGMEFNEWKTTVIFYIGLHYVDAFLATKNIHPGRHDVRDKYVAQVQELRPIYSDYSKLKNSSRTARYYPPTNFSLDQVSTLEITHLQRIRSVLGALLASP